MNEDVVRYESVYGTTVEIRREARGLWGIVIDGQRIVACDSCSHACAIAVLIAPPRKEKPTG
jgi:Fe-S-cluster-containing dehydrogenase component